MDQYDNADYYELSRILRTKDRNNRAVDPLSAITGIRSAQAKRKHRK